MSQAVTIPNSGRELALQPPQPPTRSPGWGPRGPRPALHVPAPAAGSVLGVRQRRLKLRQEVQGARPLRSGIGILVPNKHQLLLPQTTMWSCCFPSGLWRRGRVPTFFPRCHVPSLFKGRRSTLKLWRQCSYQRENIPDHLPIYVQPSWGPNATEKGGKEE